MYNVAAAPENPEINVLNAVVPRVVRRYRRMSALVTYNSAGRAHSAKVRHRIDFSIDHFKTSLAGEQNVTRLLLDIKKVLRTAPEGQKIVLYGVSRGASALLIAVTHLSGEDQRRISLLVAEAPFDSVFNVVRSRWGWMAAHVAQLAMGCCTPDDPWGDEAPIDAAEHFPHNVPVLMFSGARDQVCPIEAQRALADRLRESGHTKTTHVVLPKSSHVDMARGPDAGLYWDALQEAYNRMFSVAE